MKKINATFLLLQVAIMLGISAVAGFLISFFIGAADIVSAGVTLTIMILFVVVLCYGFFGNIITGNIAKKTIEQRAVEERFQNYSSFVADGSFGAGTIVLIDGNSDRVAYVSYQNPHEFQVVSAKNIANIKSSYIKGPFGGTRYVYFEFYYNNKKVRIPTFTSRNMYSLKSQEVLEGISKADAFCDRLLSAQNA